MLKKDAEFVPEKRYDLLNGITVLNGRAYDVSKTKTKEKEFTAIEKD